MSKVPSLASGFVVLAQKKEKPRKGIESFLAVSRNESATKSMLAEMIWAHL